MILASTTIHSYCPVWTTKCKADPWDVLFSKCIGWQDHRERFSLNLYLIYNVKLYLVSFKLVKCSKFTEMCLSLFRETTVENNQSLDQRKLYSNSCESNMPVCKIRIESYTIIFLSYNYLILI